mgnify:CR=1 FL=1
MPNKAVHNNLVSNMSVGHMTDLLIAIRDNKDKASFAKLFEHFAPRVKSYILKLGSDDVRAEEIAQQTLLQVWRKAELFDETKAAASTWIFRIARNLRLDLLRKEKHYDFEEFEFEKIIDEREAQDTVIAREQYAVIIQKAMTNLPHDQNEIIKLSFYQGMSHSEISQHLNLPLGTVKSRIRLALKRLHHLVGDVL